MYQLKMMSDYKNYTDSIEMIIIFRWMMGSSVQRNI
jgi:hypothetical protein